MMEAAEGATRDLEPVSTLLRLQIIRQALFEVATTNRPGVSAANLFSELERISIRCARPESDSGLARAVADLVRNRTRPPKDDLTALSEVIDSCRHQVLNLIEASNDAPLGISAEKAARVEKYLTEMRSPQVSLSIPDRRRRELAIERIIGQEPGLFVRLIYRRLSDMGQRPGLSYASVLNLVDSLEASGKFLTVGGPQGRERYCFPDPTRLGSWNRFYGKHFALEGEVVEKISKSFKASRPREFLDFYVTNGSNKKSVILATGSGALDRQVGKIVRTYGDLQRFGYLNWGLGYETKAKIQHRNVLVARRVAEPGRPSTAAAIWIHPTRENLFPTEDRPSS